MARFGQAFLERVFTTEEIRYCERHKSKFERYAARFAAKEAAMKALGTGWRRGVRWRDIEVRNEASGKPGIHFTGKAARTRGTPGRTARSSFDYPQWKFGFRASDTGKLRSDGREGCFVRRHRYFQPTIARPRTGDAHVQIVAADCAGPVFTLAIQRENAIFPTLLGNPELLSLLFCASARSWRARSE